MVNKLTELKRQYSEIPVPGELDLIVYEAIRKQGQKKTRRIRWIAAAAAMATLFISALNLSPTFAYASSKWPVIGPLAKVLTIREYKVEEPTYKAHIQVPAINDLGDTSLEQQLNNKYSEESKRLYDEFMVEIEDLKKAGGGEAGVASGYVVKTDTDRLLSIGRYVTNTVGSSSTTFKYDTVDKVNHVLITLPSLFIDDRFVEIISNNIKEQMIARMKQDKNSFFWVTGNGKQESDMNFKSIDKNQNFYITNDNQLVISFDKYAVAPGSMGIVEFIIPTEILADHLINQEYVK
ncbi:RsiV family protein [Paenibacillus gansuensis]|uniref:RsiV family protein n=1 Tax=Paenibacillus gansuensis TaxID=306542 RepID=A0ABW5PJN8_9BACL